ncbi:MAG: polyprenyl synthetase family protein [Sumerlaeia bacterium]
MTSSATSMTDDVFLQKAQQYSAMVDDRLAEIIAAEAPIPNLHEGLTYALGLDIADRAARGKRLRPVLGLMTAEALGADPRLALPFACAIELMHNFALVHDDIEDGDEIRRNRPTVWKRYGLAHGVNIGDYFFCKVISILMEPERLIPGMAISPNLQLRLLRLMSATLDHTHHGQAMDINARADRAFTMEKYMRLVRAKTGHYLAAPMIGGAMVAGAEQGVLDALSDFGHAIGPMFQIKDDLLDLTAGKGRGGIIGNDIKEGKRSFLVAEATTRLGDENRERLYTILDKPRSETSSDDIAWVVQAFDKCGALDAAEKRCGELLVQGLEALQRMPPRLHEMLTVASELMAKRTT